MRGEGRGKRREGREAQEEREKVAEGCCQSLWLQVDLKQAVGGETKVWERGTRNGRAWMEGAGMGGAGIGGAFGGDRRKTDKGRVGGF